MVRSLKNIIFILTNSIRKKLVLCFTFIIGALIILSGYTFFYGRALNELYNSTIQKHILLNNIFIDLGTTNELLEKYLQTGSPQVLDKYNKTYPFLFESARDLENAIADKTTNRAAVDLKYMIQSYIEEANASIIFFKEGKREQSYSHFFEAKNILKLINGSFKKVSSILTENTQKVITQIIDNKNRQYTLNGFLILIIGILCIVFVQWFSSSITKPIKKLTLAASKFSGNELSVDEVAVTSNDEIRILAEAFNKMMNKIRSQVSEIKEKAEIEKKLNDEEMENLRIKNMLKEMELKSLQSRINPHFLFNSLNLISQMAFLEEATQTTSLLEAMTELLRYNLDKFNKIVTIRDEIGNLKDYIYIQQKRFGDRIHFEIKEDEEALEYLIPCLIIQPLLENSIIHGVQSYTDNGVVGVEVSKKLERVVIRVYDNGVGIERSKLDHLKAVLENSNETNGGGIGLSNVLARLKLFYNNNVKANIKSNLGKGTEIIIDIPAITEEEGIHCTA